MMFYEGIFMNTMVLTTVSLSILNQEKLFTDGKLYFTKYWQMKNTSSFQTFAVKYTFLWKK